MAGTQVQQQRRRRRAHLPPAAPRRRSSRERLRHPKDRRCAPAHQCRQTGRQAKQGARNSEPRAARRAAKPAATLQLGQRVLSLNACCVQAQCPACLLEQPAAERVDQAANGANDDCTVRGDDSAAASNGGQACRAGVGGGWRWELARGGNGSGGLAINTEGGRLQQQGRAGGRRECACWGRDAQAVTAVWPRPAPDWLSEVTCDDAIQQGPNVPGPPQQHRQQQRGEPPGACAQRGVDRNLGCQLQGWGDGGAHIRGGTCIRLAAAQWGLLLLGRRRCLQSNAHSPAAMTTG